MIAMIVSTLLGDVKTYRFDDALKSGKIVVIEPIRTYCSYCIKMDAVFQDPEVSKVMNRDFALVKVNIDEERMPLDIKARLTPSFYFINSRSEVYKKVPGAWLKDDFLTILSEAKKAYQ